MGAGTRRLGTLGRLVAALVVTGLVAALVGTTLLIRGDDSSDPSTTTAPTLRGAAAELAALLEERQDATYHARYEGQSGEDSTIVIETWQDGAGRVRQDQVLAAAGQAAHLMSLDGGDDGPLRCSQLSEQEWTCRRAAPGEAAAADPIAAIRARLAEGEVTARDEQVDSSPARCFELVAESQRSELCVKPDTGIPVRISAGQTELRLVLLEDAVDPAAFEPPGPIS